MNDSSPTQERSSKTSTFPVNLWACVVRSPYAAHAVIETDRCQRRDRCIGFHCNFDIADLGFDAVCDGGGDGGSDARSTQTSSGEW